MSLDLSARWIDKNYLPHDENVVVIIIDTDNNTYYSHHIFTTFAAAHAFAEGMIAAWKISHGQFNCWHPFVLTACFDYEEWKSIGSPGKEKVIDYLNHYFDKYPYT